ncbi:MAG: hypothetical protein IPK32_07305 [Verrucomicrobiaceae bacterium]|nr:hypothetical protein [Verrucomicrobiaceae bacterium]
MSSKSEAQDFEYARPLAAIQTAKTVSSLHVSKAQMAAANKDMKALESEMKSAAEAWPMNPDLKQFTGNLVKSSDMRSQALLEFDRLMSQRNYRQIFQDQGVFIAALGEDPARKQQLEKVLKDMGRVQIVMEGAKELSGSGVHAAAWEKVEKEAKQFPEDPELNKLRADLGVKASEFVTAVENGRQHEEKRQTGSALAWYLKARRMFPGSEMAQQGIKRLVTTVKAGDTPQSPPYPPLWRNDRAPCSKHTISVLKSMAPATPRRTPRCVCSMK